MRPESREDHFCGRIDVQSLTVNAAGHLAGIEYTHPELGSPVTKVLSLGDHKPSGGVMLPTLVEFVRNGDLVERWTVTKWEFVEKLDDAVFDPPK